MFYKTGVIHAVFNLDYNKAEAINFGSSLWVTRNSTFNSCSCQLKDDYGASQLLVDNSLHLDNVVIKTSQVIIKTLKKCKFCDFTTSNERSVQSHMFNHHNYCKHCLNEFENKAKLNIHKRKCYRKECAICKKLYLKNHVCKKDNMCISCKKNFSRNDVFKRHILSSGHLASVEQHKKKKNLYACFQCKKIQYSDTKDLYLHFEHNHRIVIRRYDGIVGNFVTYH